MDPGENCCDSLPVLPGENTQARQRSPFPRQAAALNNSAVTKNLGVTSKNLISRLCRIRPRERERDLPVREVRSESPANFPGEKGKTINISAAVPRKSCRF